MIEGPIRQDEEFVHIRTQGIYVALNGNSDGQQDTLTRVKVGDEWLNAIVYYPEGEAGNTFVRIESDFRTKFQRRTP
jgi:hypothetical protein